MFIRSTEPNKTQPSIDYKLVESTTMPYRHISPAAKEQVIAMAAHTKTKKIVEVSKRAI